MVTPVQLKQIMPSATTAHIGWYCNSLNSAMQEFGIKTPARQSAFLAQVAQESGSLAYVRELASGADYEGREDLGNVNPGDGVKFKGRGLIQITGRENYRACGKALGIDCENVPALLETPLNACRSAAWFWYSRGLNALADTGDFERITQRINGGLTAEPQRLAFFKSAQKALA